MANIGDKGTIKRGKARGKTATIAAVQGDTLAVVITDTNELVTLDKSSFEKEPEPTIEIQTVRKAIERFESEHANNPQILQALSNLAKDLELNEEYPSEA